MKIFYTTVFSLMILLISAVNPLAEKPLIDAIKDLDQVAVKKLILSGETPNAKSLNGDTALILSIKLNATLIFDELMSAKANINAGDAYGKNPLIWSILMKNETVFFRLISEKALLNITDSNGFTPLMHATETGLLGFVEELLANGADASSRNSVGKSASDIAKTKGYQRIFDLLSYFE